MKKFILFFVLFFSINLAKAEDTITVRSHDNVHWPWYGSYARNANFPDGSFRKILMHYTLGCPNTGCSQWDYTTQIRVLVRNSPTDSFYVELARVITPYAGTFSRFWKNTWTFDVTDYASILKGDVTIDAFYGGWQDGFTISLDFQFIEGTPARKATRVQSIYHSGPGGFEYGIATNPIENHLTPVNVAFQNDETQAAFFFTPSGHSFGGNENCAEFCQKNYYLKLNGVQRFSKLMWRSDCGMNAIFPQGGTWLYDRSNWCPGDKATTHRHEIGEYFENGSSTVDLDFDAYSYNGGAGFNPNYIVDAHVIYYENFNFQRDAAIEEIIRPNKINRWNRYNAACMRPMVILKNHGSEDLTSCVIRYGIENGSMHTFTWQGNLKYGDEEWVELGEVNWWDLAENEKNFVSYVELVNNQIDENSLNNLASAAFNSPPVLLNNLELRIMTNTRGWETAYTLTNEAGEILYSGDNLESNTMHRDTFNLQDGCYELKITDSGKNGLSFWANNDGAGTARLHRMTGTTVYNFNPDFGTEISYQFMAGLGLDVEEPNTNLSFYLYPNPAQDFLYVELGQSIKSKKIIRIIDLSGRIIQENHIQDIQQQLIKTDITNLANGIYLIELVCDNQKAVKKIIVKN